MEEGLIAGIDKNKGEGERYDGERQKAVVVVFVRREDVQNGVAEGVAQGEICRGWVVKDVMGATA